MELQRFLNLLDTTTADTISLVTCENGISLQAAQKGSWNLLQVMEHIVLTDRFVYELLHKRSYYFATVMELYGEHKLRRIMVQKAEPINAPSILEPSVNPPALNVLIDRFNDTRSRLRHDLLGGSIAIDKRYYINPFLGEMTVSDWLWFIPIHTERHQLQLERMYAAINRKAC